MTQLQPMRFAPAEYKRTLYCVMPEADTPLEAVLDPSYWAHVSAQLRTGDRIEVMPEDRAYFAELIVMSVGKLQAFCAPLFARDLAPAIPAKLLELPDGYSVRWQGQTLQWSVIKTIGNNPERVLEGAATKLEAVKWAHRHFAQAAIKETPVTSAEKAAVAVRAASEL